MTKRGHQASYRHLLNANKISALQERSRFVQSSRRMSRKSFAIRLRSRIGAELFT